MRSHTKLAAKEKGIELVTSFVAPYTTKRLAKDYSLVSSNEEKVNDSTGHGDDETPRAGTSSPLSTPIDDWLPLARETTDKARRLLYLSHTFAQFAEFAWQFSMTIFLATVTNFGSLVLISTYGFASQVGVLLACPKIGSWMDDPGTERLWAVRVLIGCELFSVGVTTMCCFELLRTGNRPEDNVSQSHATDTDEGSGSTRSAAVSIGSKSLALLVIVHIFGSAVRVFDQAYTVFMERDWVVELCRASAKAMGTMEDILHLKDDKEQPSFLEPEMTDNDPKVISNSDENNEYQPSLPTNAVTDDFAANLAEMNVTMKQIDLTCKVVGPALAGVLLPFVSSSPSEIASDATSSNGLEVACLLAGLLNAMALMVEYLCTAKIYGLIPSLSCKPLPSLDSASLKSAASRGYSFFTCRELRLYFLQPVAFEGLSLALLYCNGLTFSNGILTTYLLYRRMPLPTIGLLRGVASAIGLLGTCAYRISIRYLSLKSTGLWSIIYECVCLGLAYLSILLGTDTSVATLVLMITGVCASRIGLWVFDIAVTQMQQQQVPDGVRVSVGGVQSALNAFFTLASFSVGIMFPDPAYFHLYVQCAFLSVAVATLTYVYGSCQR